MRGRRWTYRCVSSMITLTGRNKGEITVFLLLIECEVPIFFFNYRRIHFPDTYGLSRFAFELV